MITALQAIRLRTQEPCLEAGLEWIKRKSNHALGSCLPENWKKGLSPVIRAVGKWCGVLRDEATEVL